MKLEKATKNKCCCNCKHDIRKVTENGITNYCDIDGEYIGYIQCFDNKCAEWQLEDQKKWRLRKKKCEKS